MTKDKCPGCGIKIQTTNSNEFGYIREDVLSRSGDDFLCERCFRLKNYNELKTTTLGVSLEEVLEIIDSIAQDSLIVNVIDAFDLDGTIIPTINEMFNKHNVLVIANKYDLFLRSNRPTKIKKYINHYFDCLNVKTCGIIVTSSYDLVGIEKLYQSLLRITSEVTPQNNKIYFVGVTNVGKSSLIKVLSEVIEKHESSLIVSNAVGTTLGLNEVRVGDLVIIDTPGIYNPKQITYYLSKTTLNYAIPNKFVKPKSFQLNSHQTLFIEGFGWFSYYGEQKCSFVTYFSNNLKLHRCKSENAMKFYDLHQDDIFRFPNASEREKLGKLVIHQFINVKDVEISLSGLGFLGFYGCGDVEVVTFENILVAKRNQLI